MDEASPLHDAIMQANTLAADGKPAPEELIDLLTIAASAPHPDGIREGLPEWLAFRDRWRDADVVKQVDHRRRQVETSQAIILPDPWATLGVPTAEDPSDGLTAISAADLVSTFTTYKPVLIDGLLREGETMNIIAAPKTGKSWLVLQMAFSLANGLPFLGRTCAKVGVLIVDNELHHETAAQRLRSVADAMGCPLAGVHVLSLRGRLRDLMQLHDPLQREVAKAQAKVIVLDALYRLLPPDTSENDNAGMMQLYNELDRIAAASGASIVCIHHSSKGNQAEKSVTDGGAGAGSIARAADSHLYLREHETAGCVTLDAVCRSFAPPPPTVLRRGEGNLWTQAIGEDPSRLKGRRRIRTPTEVNADDILPLVPDLPASLATIAADIEQRGMVVGKDRLRGFLGILVQEGLIVAETTAHGAKLYGRAASPVPQATKEDQAVAYLRRHPHANKSTVAAAVGCDDKTVQRARGRIRAEELAGVDKGEDNQGDNQGDNIPVPEDRHVSCPM